MCLCSCTRNLRTLSTLPSFLKHIRLLFFRVCLPLPKPLIPEIRLRKPDVSLTPKKLGFGSSLLWRVTANLIQLPWCHQASFACPPQLPKPAGVVFVLDYIASVLVPHCRGSLLKPGTARCWASPGGKHYRLLLQRPTSVGDQKLNEAGSWTDTAALFLCSGLLINSL